MKTTIWTLYLLSCLVENALQTCHYVVDDHYLINYGYYTPAERVCESINLCGIECNDWDETSLFNLIPFCSQHDWRWVKGHEQLEHICLDIHSYDNLTISSTNVPTLSAAFEQEEIHHGEYYYRINVRSLILEKIGLKDISKGAFKFFHESSEVHLSKNQLRSIEDGVFDPLIKLVLLDLSYNELTSIADHAFEKNKELSHLYLNNNKLISVKAVFHPLVCLEVFDISENPLQNLFKWSFNNYSHLVTVNMSRTNLNESMVDFTQNIELRELIMRQNIFTALNENIFSNMSKLFKLDFRYNKINSLKGDFFKNLFNLEILLLKGNTIKKIDADTFLQNRQLITLDLSENIIDLIDPSAFENLINLEKLYLNHNHLKTLSNLLPKQNNLTRLTVTDNPFETVPLEWHFPKVKQLNLTDFRVNFDPVQFSLMLEIESINLSNNTLTTISRKMFANLTHLTLLDASHNLLKSIDDQAFKDLCSLETLKLQDNKLKSISPHIFNNMHDLKYLDLSFNKFINFSTGTFDNCRYLVVLNLSFNEITTITKFNLHQQIHLEALYLHNNNLSKFEATEFLRSSKSFSNISIENNDWNCDYLFDLLQKFDGSGVRIIGATETDYSKKHIRSISCHDKLNNKSGNSGEIVYFESNKNDNIKLLRKFMLQMFEEINDNLKNISQILESSEHVSHLDQYAVPLDESIKSETKETTSLEPVEEKANNETKTLLYLLIFFGICILSISYFNLYYKIRKVKKRERIECFNSAL